ncbi:hypothetical protein L873DRAFT_1377434 [Choiromyces venosus 120613-1]|uniref:Uncharacterized protein n=1 Tax=Choiromyces venosus 120613-1 TaxID=1336337 RepID=A0A3N4IVQ5_9PEZI|nr:hypothetical protein L873DRAFT_1377434 [Choiromyces venosus 120613-1]
MHNSAPSLFYLIGLFMIRYQTPHHKPIYTELLVTTDEGSDRNTAGSTEERHTTSSQQNLISLKFRNRSLNRAIEGTHIEVGCYIQPRRCWHYKIPELGILEGSVSWVVLLEA